jgi:alpha-tubulin suppressor-like RCC1 family protein
MLAGVLAPVAGAVTASRAAAAVFPLGASSASIATANGHACALTSSGGVQCWGWNTRGQLGDGTTTDHAAPAAVVGLASGVAAVAVGIEHSCALTTAGAVECWGSNDNGELGNGSGAEQAEPVAVTGLSSGVVAISASGFSSCAVTDVGAVKCWGWNANGQLGDGTTTNRSTPVAVQGLSTGVVAVDLSNQHACALLASGAVRCWGSNSRGQLGDGTTTARLTPVTASAFPANVTGISAGGDATCVLTTARGVQCLGYNGNGQLGDGTTTERHTAGDVTGLSSGVRQLSVGAQHVCAVMTAGGVKCWGQGSSGQVGDGLLSKSLVPVDVIGLASGVAAVSAGTFGTCAVLMDGAAKCWGVNAVGQLGTGLLRDRPAPVEVQGLAPGALDIVAGGAHSCVRTAAEGIRCWGNNFDGELGDGTHVSRWTAADVESLTSDVAVVAAGDSDTCAVTNDGALKCWGRLSGDSPADVHGLTSDVESVSVGDSHICALTVAGGVQCWGLNAAGQLGDGTTTDASAPIGVVGLTSGVMAISAGESHTCALTVAGGVKCWGANFGGQLGNGTTTSSATPVDVSGLESGVSSISAGAQSTCAVTDAGALRCWGSNGNFELGNGTQTWSSVPVDVTGMSSGVSSVTVGLASACARTTAGGVKCWGQNAWGQLGDGTFTNRSTPVDVSGMTSGVTSLSTTSIHTCAVQAGVSSCWGTNGSGQLGTNPGWTPLDVVGSFWAATAPDAPRVGTAVAGNGTLTLPFAPGPDGGNAATSFGASCTSSDGGAPAVASGSGTPISVGGVSIGKTYSCTVTATNAVGTSPASDASNSVLAARVPDAPTIGTATRGNRSITVAFSPPASDGASLITSYAASCSSSNGGTPGAASAGANPIVVGSLTNGASYTCTVTATNDVGTGPASDASEAVVPATVPGAPPSVTAERGDGQATVSWTAPLSNGGSALTGYIVTPSANGTPETPIDVESSATTTVITGLTNGDSYTFRVAAKNAVGTGSASPVSSPVVPGAVPDAPTGVVATSKPTRVSIGTLYVAFTAGDDNGLPLTSISVTCTSSDGGARRTRVVAGTNTWAPIGKVATKKTYTCTATSANAAGTGPVSHPSVPVIVGAPGAPTRVRVARLGTGKVRVSYAAGNNNGAKVVKFAAACVSTNGGVARSRTVATGPITMTGLTAGRSYVCRVKALNSRGWSRQSLTSPTVKA